MNVKIEDCNRGTLQPIKHWTSRKIYPVSHVSSSTERMAELMALKMDAEFANLIN